MNDKLFKEEISNKARSSYDVFFGQKELTRNEWVAHFLQVYSLALGSVDCENELAPVRPEMFLRKLTSDLLCFYAIQQKIGIDGAIRNFKRYCFTWYEHSSIKDLVIPIAGFVEDRPFLEEESRIWLAIETTVSIIHRLESDKLKMRSDYWWNAEN